ncbi:hypothetical protein IIM65_004706 [Escherichia coli]|nr:hypothetical protein [Escherichia coli]
MSRFILGDCVRVMATFPGNAVDFILTDPPYLVGFRDRSGRTIAGDKTDEWLQPACNEMYRVLKKDALMVSFYGWNRVDRFMAAWKNAGFSVVGHLVFTKNYTSKAAYVGYRHECAYILAKGRPRLPQNPLPDVLGWKYSGNRHHPTEKPVSVVDGNYSYGNMQTENVNGFSWSTNSTTSFGQMMYQTGSGATATQTRDGNMVMDASGAMSRLPVGINATRQIAAAQQEMAREASNRAESALHGFSSSIASAWNSLSQFGSNRGSSDSVTGGADSTMSAQDSMMASRMRSAVESYAKAHNISNEQATQELASRSTRASAGMYGDAHAEWGVKPKILGVGGGLGVRGGGRAGIDWEDNDAHTASSNTQSSHNARHDIDARATQDFKEASDYFTSRKVSESGSHTDNNADSRVDQLSAALNSAKQSYDQYTTNMTRSHEYAEMASRTESMSGQMSEDLSQQFAQYVMKHAPQDAEAILTNTSSPEIAERRRAMAWSFVQEQVQPGVDNAWRESRGDIGKGMESVPSGGGSQDIIADHQGHQAIIDQRTQDSNIRNDVKHQVDNMVTEYKGNIGDTQNSVRGEENIVRGQYSELQNHHKTEALSQNNKYNEEKSAQERMPGADSPQELMKRAKEYQDKYKQ